MDTFHKVLVAAEGVSNGFFPNILQDFGNIAHFMY